MNGPLVSIIIPVYNAEKYLAECIESAIRQTWPHKKVIVVNDGSTDASLNIARQYEGGHVKVISQKNKGAAAARNRGIAGAEGEYIQFLDADDILSPDKIERQLAVLAGLPNHVAICSTVHFNTADEYRNLLPNPYEEQFIHDITTPEEFLIRLWGGYDNKGSMIQPNAWLTPKRVIEKAGLWNESLSLDDDGEFFCRVILQADGIVHTSGVFNYYRKHIGTLSGQHSFKGLKSLLDSVLSKKQQLLSRNNSPAARHAVYRQLYDVFLLAYPRYPAIYRQALKNLPESGLIYQPVVGGKLINTLAKLLGIRTALRLRHFTQWAKG